MQKIHAVTVSVIVPQLIDNAFDNATKIRPTFLKFATFQSEMQFSNFIRILPTKYHKTIYCIFEIAFNFCKIDDIQVLPNSI